jgi:hypothetical protein
MPFDGNWIDFWCKFSLSRWINVKTIDTGIYSQIKVHIYLHTFIYPFISKRASFTSKPFINLLIHLKINQKAFFHIFSHIFFPWWWLYLQSPQTNEYRVLFCLVSVANKNDFLYFLVDDKILSDRILFVTVNPILF